MRKLLTAVVVSSISISAVAHNTEFSGRAWQYEHHHLIEKESPRISVVGKAADVRTASDSVRRGHAWAPELRDFALSPPPNRA